MNPPLMFGFLCGLVAGLVLGFVIWAPRERRSAPRPVAAPIPVPEPEKGEPSDTPGFLDRWLAGSPTIGDKVLVTCDNWFFAPDGHMYRAVFGTLRAVRTAEDTLGIRPNGKSANWYLEVGNMTIAGCQVHYVLKTDEVSFDSILQESVHEGRYVSSQRATEIYNAGQA